MIRPEGISRQQYRDMLALLKERMGERAYVVEFYLDSSIVAEHVMRDEEGYSRTTVTIHVAFDAAPGERVYNYQQWSRGKDCDGVIEDTTEGTVRPRRKRERFYLGCRPSMRRIYGRDAQCGRFEMKSAFRHVNEPSRSHRDFSAEAAGY